MALHAAMLALAIHPAGNDNSAVLLLLAVVAFAVSTSIFAVSWRGLRAADNALTTTETGKGRLSGLAMRDELTGMLNARAFFEQGARLLDSTKGRGKSLAVLVIDVAPAPRVDLSGTAKHIDTAMQHVTPRIVSVFPAGSLAARLDGWTFAAALPFDGAHPMPIERVAERLLALFGEPIDTPGGAIPVTPSIGMASADTVAGGIAALLEAATEAARSASGPDGAHMFWHSDAVVQKAQARKVIESGLRHAVASEQIVPFFQQQIDLATGQLVGLEVLARWDHPTRGVIQPLEFIAAAEQNGTIGDLSLLVMRQAFVAARDWDKSLTLSVNISPVQMRDPLITQKIVMLLAQTGFHPARLEIEITEAALFADLAIAQSIAAAIKNHGMAIALDDFGTGFSSIAHLRALPFDRIKADRSFVTEMQRSVNSASLVRALIGLGETLRLPVTAEGIETAEVAQQLRTLGCARGQGHLYGRPENAANTRRLIAERRLLAHATMPLAGPASARLAG